ncbi:MAG: hypothetical protein JWM76_4692 [Pseudonocardiales bacterium]|nr:hypothetical protein [Pseudonocardiales bacterium]
MTTPGGDRPPVDIRAQLRQQMIDGFGGWTGMVITAIPTVVFVIANSIGSLRNAVIAAIASALALTGYRLSRKQPIQQALNGLFGVLVAALIAARTGQARGYFLLGIYSSFVYGGVFLASIVARRPLVGVIWEFLDPTPSDEELAGKPVADGAEFGPGATEPTPWHRRRYLASAYLLATIGATLVFAARGLVQLSLFRQNSTGWLAVTRIAMGYPLTIAVFAFAWFMVRRARTRLRAASA